MEMTKGWMKNESYPTFMGWSREKMEGLDGRRRGKLEMMEEWMKKNEGWMGWMDGEGGKMEGLNG